MAAASGQWPPGPGKRASRPGQEAARPTGHKQRQASEAIRTRSGPVNSEVALAATWGRQPILPSRPRRHPSRG